MFASSEDRYDWAVHFNPSFNHELISSKVYMVKHGLRSGQSVFLQGVLRKEGEELVLKCGKRSNLIISTQSIEEEQINNRKSGTFLLLLGSMLLAGGIYRFLNSFVFSKPVTKPIDWKQLSVAFSSLFQRIAYYHLVCNHCTSPLLRLYAHKQSHKGTIMHYYHYYLSVRVCVATFTKVSKGRGGSCTSTGCGK